MRPDVNQRRPVGLRITLSRLVAGVVLLGFSAFPAGPAASQEGAAVGTCPNYTPDPQTGEPVCRSVVRPGETFFYWAPLPDGSRKFKHSFVFRNAEGRIVQFAAFTRLDSNGLLKSQAWTNETLDDWIDSYSINDGVPSFCKYQGGVCQPVTGCSLPIVREYHGNMRRSYETIVRTNDPLAMSYAYELYNRADKFLGFCTYIESRRGPPDERRNIRP